MFFFFALGKVSIRAKQNTETAKLYFKILIFYQYILDIYSIFIFTG
jgi:hypothetical protein